MPKKSRKHKRNHNNKTSKNTSIVMVGCSNKNKNKNKKTNITLEKYCSNCGPNCHCRSNCKCLHPCPGKCYLNHRLKGGTGCGSCGCPIAPLSYEQIKKFGGGINNDPIEFGPILGIGQNGGVLPGPIVGSSWGKTVNEWPGMDGISGNRNIFSQVDVVKNPQLKMQLDDSGYKNTNSSVGGSNKKSKKSKGGGIIPQDLVNLGRNFTFNLNSAYNALNGYKAPVDPLPYKNQLSGSLNNNKFLI